MFNPFAKDKDDQHNEAIADIYARMRVVGPDDAEYPKLINMLTELSDITPKKGLRSVSPDTLMIVAGNLIGILVIVGYEQKHVITSKAVGFIMKSKT